MKIAVIGAGASGLMASGMLAKNGHNVTVFEKKEKVGRKIVITGKGRCNVTNNCTPEEFFENVPRNSKFLYSAIRTFTPSDAIDFFEEIGLNVKTERGKRVFPVSDNALEVVDKLLAFCKDQRVKFVNETVTKVGSHDGEQVEFLQTDKGRYDFDKIIIATGGVSYPKTGSTGDGYTFAEKFGHKIEEIEPSLVALVSQDSDLPDLMGLSLKNVKVTLKENEKTIFSDFGEMVFTHFGVSGPIILSASAHILKKTNHKILIDLKPALDEQTLDKRILRDFEKNMNKDFVNSLGDLLPRKLISVIIARTGIDAHLKVNFITKEQRKKLVKTLKEFEIKIDRKADIDEAIVTRGGVSVKEINPKTLESKKIKNLYFIGEVLDVDAYTGGFNLQIAWSTGYLLAQNMA